MGEPTATYGFLLSLIASLAFKACLYSNLFCFLLLSTFFLFCQVMVYIYPCMFQLKSFWPPFFNFHLPVMYTKGRRKLLTCVSNIPILGSKSSWLTDCWSVLCSPIRCASNFSTLCCSSFNCRVNILTTSLISLAHCILYGIFNNLSSSLLKALVSSGDQRCRVELWLGDTRWLLAGVYNLVVGSLQGKVSVIKSLRGMPPCFTDFLQFMVFFPLLVSNSPRVSHLSSTRTHFATFMVETSLNRAYPPNDRCDIFTQFV